MNRIRICSVCGKKFKIMDYHASKRMFCSKECQKKRASEKAREKFRKKKPPFNLTKKCVICDKEFKVKNYLFNCQQTCSEECRKEQKIRRENLPKNIRKRKKSFRKHYREMKQKDPFRYKASLFKERLRWGKGATQKMMKFIANYLGEPCGYCGKILTLDNMSLDHKVPLRFNTTKNTSEAEKLNQEENLHMVCRECNHIKGEIPHKKYTKLIKFLNEDKELGDIIRKRLKSSYLIYKR